MREFIFSDGESTLTATGIARFWPTPMDAVKALQTGSVPLIVGALPFYTTETPALFTPDHYRHHLGTPELPDGCVPAPTSIDEHPSTEQHAERVASAVAAIERGQVAKIVLARRETYHFDRDVNPEVLLSRFIDGSGTGTGYLVDISVAGRSHLGETIVGSSPELLIRKRGNRIESHPLAGTAPRSTDPVQDEARATELLLSPKDLDEHAYVTSEIDRVLRPYCTELHVPRRPSLTRTSHTWHLGTPITGTLGDGRVSVLELAVALHPTPAVAGHPTSSALDLLRTYEPERGFYAGTVGWADEHGDGEWRVTIRSCVVDSRAHQIRAHAGGGIVATSVPDTEVRETRTKFGPLRAALGIHTTPESKARHVRTH
ncbi:isochorismate synthase [Corynebacterium sp. P5848]|uniref:isochorismate synthase n=1 Tax=Corynebacterium marambiense TaxID=2765364 RepID=UPI002260B554|nr:isochorismate synthase [Corynebacterium marambiense]MCX7541585.1 isochorismate synthase [Corynebacterium marambiense]